MNTKALRQKILDLAIHGKLVPQDPNDEPASVLLQRIKAEKERLIKEGKIKRAKKSKATCDKPHYPYELPKGWVWTTLPELCVIPITDGTHQTPTYTDKANGIPFLSSKDVTSQKVDWANIKYITKDLHEILYKRIAPQKNDILLAKNGTTGVAAIVEDERVFDIYVTLAVIRPSHFIVPKFLLYIINSDFCRTQFNDHLTGIGLPNLHLTDIKKTIIPVPPYQEQVRIVDEINRLFKRIDVVDKGQLNTNKLLRQAKDKILDLAIHGKLVPQDPTDEPATELLKRINPKAEITCDNGHYQKNKQFEIPSTWVLCKLGAVNEIARGGSPRPIKDYLTNDANGINWIKIGDTTKDGKYINSVKEKIRPEGVKKSRLVHKGDFLLTNSMSYGRPYILNVDGCIHDGWLVISPIGKAYTSNFLYYLLSSSFAYEQFTNVASGGVVTNLNSDKVADTIFPLPPYTEQHRIVAKIEEIFAQLDAIEASL